MELPSQEKLEGLREQGLRPQIVACVLSGKEVLFVYKKEHDLWQLPQGGVEAGETISEAFFREVEEELGIDLASSIEKNIILLGDDKIIFPPGIQNRKMIKSSEGKQIAMKGKYYYFLAAISSLKNLDLTQTEFDNYSWVSHAGAMDLVKKIYQKGKKRVTNEIINKLKLGKFIE